MKVSKESATASPLPSGDTPASLGRAVAFAVAGPVLALSDLSTRFFLVEAGFARQHEGIVLGIGAVFCALALGASVVSRHLQRHARGRAREVEFVCALGVALGAFSAVVIVAALLPHAYFAGEGTP
jgi:hypothetical protein